MKRTIYHGCGHFWVRMTITWDDGIEVVEASYFDGHCKETPGK